MQVFCLTVIFGLFHGLVLLPVLLSMLGPSASPDTGSIATQSCSVSSSSSRSESPAPAPAPAPPPHKHQAPLSPSWTAARSVRL